MKKFITIITLVLSTIALANDTCPPSVASACYKEHTKLGHSRSISIRLCSNLSNTCYMEMRDEEYSIKKSISTCTNVANSCYEDITRIFHTRAAAKTCKNINNRCYVSERNLGARTIDARESCRDLRSECSICGDNELDIQLRLFFGVKQ